MLSSYVPESDMLLCCLLSLVSCYHPMYQRVHALCSTVLALLGIMLSSSVVHVARAVGPMPIVLEVMMLPLVLAQGL